MSITICITTSRFYQIGVAHNTYMPATISDAIEYDGQRSWYGVVLRIIYDPTKQERALRLHPSVTGALRFFFSFSRAIDLQLSRCLSLLFPYL